MADEPTEITQVTRIIGFIKRPDDLVREMARHPQLCCLFVTFFTSLVVDYVYSSKGKPVILPPRPPVPFFPVNGPVHDAPTGMLGPLVQALQHEDLALVLYYAPWCSKSQEARLEYLKAAQYFKDKVHFAAINCWWPEGECKKRYKFLMFPTLMAYHTKLDGYRFFGDFRAEHIVKFVERLMYPMSIVHSREELVKLVARHDSVVVGHFNLSSDDHIGSYRQFYFASMRIVERDPIQPVHFTVVSQEDVAKQLGMTGYLNIVLYRVTNTSMTYPYGNNITSSNIVNWLLEHKGQEVVKRLSPEGIKSKALATEIEKGPAFILFHDEDPLFNVEPNFQLVKDIALLYNRCKIHPLFKDIHKTLLEISKTGSDVLKELLRTCGNLDRSKLSPSQEQEEQLRVCCMSALVSSSNGSSNILCSLCIPGPTKHSCQQISHLLPALSDNKNNTRTVGNSTSGKRGSPPLDCRNTLLNYSESGKLSLCCHQRSSTSDVIEGCSRKVSQCPSRHNDDWSHGTAIVEDGNSWVSPDILGSSKFVDQTWGELGFRRRTDRYIRQHLETLPRQLCDRLAYSSPTIPSLSPSQLRNNTKMFSKLSAFGCNSEEGRHMHFYSMDKHSHWMFADVLGVSFQNVSENVAGATAVIIDKENDEHFVLKESLTYLSTLSFIVDFELGLLKRHQNSHKFDQVNCSIGNKVCVQELATHTFEHMISTSNQDVVVLIYAHWCGFCQTLSHTFLALANYFVPSNITFARINGATNDLPWQFTFTSYPAVIFFPAKRPQDSVVFPPQHSLSMPSLVKFVLHHARPSSRLLHVADVCSHACVTRNLLRSQALLQTLQRRSGRLQKRLAELLMSNEVEGKAGLNVLSLTAHHNQVYMQGSTVDNTKSLPRVESVDDKTSDIQRPMKDTKTNVQSSGSTVGDAVRSKVSTGSSIVQDSLKSSSHIYYSSLSIEYLQSRLQDIGKRMERLTKLIQVLQLTDGGTISKHQLLNVMQYKGSTVGS